MTSHAHALTFRAAHGSLASCVTLLQPAFTAAEAKVKAERDRARLLRVQTNRARLAAHVHRTNAAHDKTVVRRPHHHSCGCYVCVFEKTQCMLCCLVWARGFCGFCGFCRRTVCEGASSRDCSTTKCWLTALSETD